MATNNKTLTVRLEVRAEKVRRDLEGILRSVPGFELREKNGPVDLLILEVGADLSRDMREVERLRSSGEARDIFLTAEHADPELLLRALRLGIKEFFVQPLKAEEVHPVLAAYAARRGGAATASAAAGSVAYLIGSKGGVGTTTVAVNLASKLVEADPACKVALIDMNLLFGEVPLFLDMEPAFNWGEVAKNIARLDATYLMSVLTRHASGIHVLPSPSQLDRVHAATPDTVERLLRLMRTQFDAIVIDGGQSIDEVSLKLMELADSVLIVSILSLPCLINVRRLYETFAGLGYPPESRVRVVVNRYHKNSVISLKDAEKGLGRAIGWTIPNDYQATMQAINQGKLLRDVAPKAEITRNIGELAATLRPGRAGKARKP